MESSPTKAPSPKERLLHAAQELFGDRDPADVSVRELARKANVNIAAINYHYRSKEGLYQAVVECIITMMAGVFQQARQDFEEAKQHLSKQKDICLREKKTFYISWYKKFIETIARTILTRHLEGNSLHKLMIREQMTGGSGFGLLYERLNFFFALMDECLEEITGEKGRKNILRVHAILGQIIIFVATSATIAKRLDVDKTGEHDVEEMVEVILENSGAVLQHLSEKRRES